MREKIIRFFKMWTLPLGMCAGFAVYFLFHYIPWLSPLKMLANGAEDYLLPAMVFIQLFTTFCKVNPREMRIKRWHVAMITVQLACCLLVALPIHFFPTSRTMSWRRAHWYASLCLQARLRQSLPDGLAAMKPH